MWPYEQLQDCQTDNLDCFEVVVKQGRTTLSNHNYKETTVTIKRKYEI